MSGPGGKSSARKLTSRERTAKAIELRKAGLTFAQIGKVVGCSESGAYRAVMRELARLNAQTADDMLALRELQLQRLDVILTQCWRVLQDDATNSDAKMRAADRVIKVLERQSKLLGLDAPVRQELSGPGGSPIQTEDVRPKLHKLMEDPEAMAAMRVIAKKQAALASPAHTNSAGNSTQTMNHQRISENENSHWPRR